MIKQANGNADINNYNFVPAEKYEHLTDNEIIQRVLAGNISFFEVLMRRYNQRLFRIQRGYISDEEAIKDTLQLTYIKAFENLDSFRGDAKFSTWITRIAINEALKYLNKRKRYSKLELVDDHTAMNEHTVNSNQTPEDHTIQNDFKHLLEKVIDGLPSKYRSVYLMREIEDMDTQETAECLDLSQSNVKVRLHRAKKMLQDKLERKVVDTEVFNFLGDRCDRLVFSVMQKVNSKK